MNYNKFSLKFWIEIIFVLMILGSILISLHPNNRFSNLITFNGSLAGGLVTLISVFITNKYYNEEKLNQDLENRKEKLKLKLKALKFLKKEIIDNKDKYNNGIIGYKFQSAIWEEFRREFIEVFINYPEQELSVLQEFYILIMEQDNTVATYKIEYIRSQKLFISIEESINKAISDYQNKYDQLIKKIKNPN